MVSTDELGGRYHIEFRVNKPDLLENTLTLGAATLVNEAAKKVFDVGDGWECKITDSVTDLWECRSGATKGEAQEAAFRALKRKVDGFLEDQEKERSRQKDEHERRRSERQQHEHDSSAGDNSGTEFIGKLIGALIVIVAIVWFVFAVAIPLLVIDIAAITLIAALVRKDLSKWLLPLSLVGAVLVVADYNRGWFTKSLATNVPFLAGLVPILFYVNVLAGLIAAYFLIRGFLDERNPPPDGDGELTQRNMIVMGCLLLVGCLTFGLQQMIDSQRRHARQSMATVSPSSTTGNVATPAAGAGQVGSEPTISTDAFAGTWEYTDSQGDVRYLRIVKMDGGQFQLFEGWPGEQGAVGWRDEGYYLVVANRKLTATIQSGNFRATHGAVFEYRLAVERIDDNNLLYTVKSELTNANEAEKARRITQSAVNVSQPETTSVEPAVPIPGPVTTKGPLREPVHKGNGVVEIHAEPGSEVFLDGQAEGFCDDNGAAVLRDIIEGDHEVTAKNWHYFDAHSRFSLATNENKQINLQMKWMGAYLTVTVEPAGALIHVAGPRAFDGSASDAKIPTGEYSVTVSAPNYIPQTRTFVVGPFQHHDEHFQLTIDPVAANVGADARNAGNSKAGD